MKCPFCATLDSKVVDSRPANDGTSIRRRRECLKCHNRFTTYETIEVLPMIVIKKNGIRQAFDRSKLMTSMLKACEKRSVSLSLLEKAAEHDRFYVIGQVGDRALRKDPRLVKEFQYGATAPSLQRARDITVDAIDDFKSGKLDEIYLIYTKIQNALTSEPVMERLLPLDREHLQPAPKGLGDPRGEVELVPDAWTVFEQTAPIYMHGMIFGAMTESFCAEQSARMTAMDSATKSANDMIRDLQLEYNRTRQGSITQEITEIIGGASAVKNQE